MNAELSTVKPASLGNVAWLFEELAAIYGDKFVQMWGKADPERMKATWARALSGFTLKEVKAGLEACLKKPWPPTLPEFLLMCRPAPDYEAMFNEAAEQSYKRRYGTDSWSSPVVFWAAYRLGYEALRSNFAVVKRRWVQVVDEVLQEPLEPIPAGSKQVEYSEPSSAEVARLALAECKRVLKRAAA